MGKLNLNLLKGIEEQEKSIEEGKKQTKTSERMEQIPTFYNMGITSPELLGIVIGKVLGEDKPIHRGTISNLITGIKESQPDRLTEPPEELPTDKQRKLMEEFLSNTTQAHTGTPEATEKPTESPEPPQPIQSTPTEEKAPKKANTKATKTEKKIMGFRATEERMGIWRLYADATGQEVGAFCTAAIDEYMERHPLTPEQKQVFDIKIKQLNC